MGWGYSNCILIWLLYAGGRVITILILKLCVKVGGRAIDEEGCIGDIQNHYIGGRPKGLPIEAAVVHLELILMRERSFDTPQSGANITAFGKGNKSRIASDLSCKFKVAGPSQGHTTVGCQKCPSRAYFQVDNPIKLLLPFSKVLRKSKLSEPPTRRRSFYKNAFTTTKNKSCL